MTLLSRSLALALLSPLAAAQQGVQSQELTPPDGQPGDGFGYRIERAADIAIVAATFDDDLGLDSGSAYVYTRDAVRGWELAKKLHASDGAAGDLFGYSVAVDGQRVLVGAVAHDGGANDQGALYVFARDQGGAGNWGEVAHFTPQGLPAGAGFGYALAVRGDRLLVGAPHHALGVAGRAFLYRRDATSASGWTLELEFTSADPATAFEFGQDVALGEDVLAVSGSRTSIQPYSDTYAVHIRERDAGGSGNWGEVRRLESPAATRDLFGWELSIDGDRLATVAPAEWDPSTNSIGALYLFRRDLGGASHWGLERRLVAPRADGLFVADEIDLGRDWLVAGSFGIDVHGASSAGAAFAFARNAGGRDAWGYVGELDGDEPEADAFFGLDLTLSGDELLVGASGRYTGASSGEAYALDLAHLARATWRNDAAGANPDVHRALTRPLLGTTYVAEVDLAATGHDSALLLAFARAADLPLSGGRALLGRTPLGSALSHGPRARFSFALPADAGLSGLTLATQALLTGGGQPFALSNAQDLVLGLP